MLKQIGLVALALSLASLAVAEDYQFQIDGFYQDAGSEDVYGVTGTYYFETVATAGIALDEAEFLGRNSNVSLDYTTIDDNTVPPLDIDFISVQGEYYGKTNNIYARAAYIDIDTDFGGDEVFDVEVGYFVAQNWLLSAQTILSDSNDDSYSINSKYVTELSGDRTINLEINYDNVDGGDNDFSALADYYWSDRGSVGLGLTTEDNTDYLLQAHYFFMPNFAGRLAYVANDVDDVTQVGVTVRF